MQITQEDIDQLAAQQEFAKDKMAARWSQLSERMEDMSRLLTGESHDDDADAELVGMCVETCWAQCTVFWADMQLMAAIKQMEEDKANETT